jgi:hypothetical protein
VFSAETRFSGINISVSGIQDPGGKKIMMIESEILRSAAEELFFSVTFCEKFCLLI